jgi:hypothetical protein
METHLARQIATDVTSWTRVINIGDAQCGPASHQDNTERAERIRAPSQTERVSPPSTRMFWPVM